MLKVTWKTKIGQNDYQIITSVISEGKKYFFPEYITIQRTLSQSMRDNRRKHSWHLKIMGIILIRMAIIKKQRK